MYTAQNAGVGFNLSMIYKRSFLLYPLFYDNNSENNDRRKIQVRQKKISLFFFFFYSCYCIADILIVSGRTLTLTSIPFLGLANVTDSAAFFLKKLPNHVILACNLLFNVK